jgi:hypothetical protein
MARRNFPEWLDSFSLTVSDENENGLFHSYDFDVNDIRFLTIIGGAIGTEIKIKDKKYKIVDAKFLTDLTENNIGKENGYSFQLDIIVREM